MLIGPDRAECILDGTLGDFVEGHAANAVVGQVECLLQVPGDGFAFAVRVGRQIDEPGLGGGSLELADRVFLGRHDFVRGLVALGDVEPELALGQVAHMAHARLHHIGRTEKLVDRLGLLGALDDHQRRAGRRWARLRNYLSDFLPDGALRSATPSAAAVRLGAGFFGPVSSVERSRLLGLASHGAVLPILFSDDCLGRSSPRSCGRTSNA